jgi:REP element-mobilizing transposase RayT
MKHRRSIRLRDFDYTQAGAYFVTICTHSAITWLGSIAGGEVRLSEIGMIVTEEWAKLPGRFPSIGLDSFVAMPNHVHGILVMQPISGHPGPKLGQVIRSFKAASARRVHTAGTTGFAWQRNFYEHVIRSAGEWDRIRRYIDSNPVRWELDGENPDRTGTDEFDEWISEGRA